MKFRVKSIAVASAMVSLCVALLALFWAVYLGEDVLSMVIIALCSSALCFVVSYLIFHRFVIYRIKPIYQIILSKSVKTSELKRQGDIVEGIHNTLNSWALSQEDEIIRLKENEVYRKEFLGNVSHELKTPIFNIQGYILTLIDGGIDDNKIKWKYLERAEKSIDRLIDIVQDLEDISKLEAGKLVLDKKAFDIVALCREVAEAEEMTASGRGISIKVGTGITQPAVVVNADKGRIDQVITNLVTNAVKYGRDNGRVEIDLIVVFGKVIIEVSDNGIGISEENISRVFERFFRVDKSRSREQGGTGLGLAIVKHIIEAHGHSITVRSELGKGTTFSFALDKAQ